MNVDGVSSIDILRLHLFRCEIDIYFLEYTPVPFSKQVLNYILSYKLLIISSLKYKGSGYFHTITTHIREPYIFHQNYCMIVLSIIIFLYVWGKRSPENGLLAVVVFGFSCCHTYIVECRCGAPFFL